MERSRETEPDSEIFRELLDGNKRFRRQNSDFRKLSDGQNPEFVVISCSDSRVSPSIVTDSQLGRIFEIRVAGSVLDESSIASVEFALEKLKVKGVLVVGHTKCGAVTEAQKLFVKRERATPEHSTEPLGRIVESIYEIISVNSRNREDLTNAVKENTRAQLERLLESRIALKKYNSGSVVFSAAMYEIESGRLELI